MVPETEASAAQASVDPLRRYTQPEHEHSPGTAQAGVNVASVQVKVTNTGKVAGDEVVFIYHNASTATERWNREQQQRASLPLQPDPTAKKQLIGYQRVSLAPGTPQSGSTPS